MTIMLSPETERMLQDRMRIGGFRSEDEAVRAALENLQSLDCDRSPETIAAIREGLQDVREGRTRPWEQVKAELNARFPHE
jgi:Arc/MetJ-type ribon-helix-helix transcriptional regulator